MQCKKTETSGSVQVFIVPDRRLRLVLDDAKCHSHRSKSILKDYIDTVSQDHPGWSQCHLFAWLCACIRLKAVLGLCVVFYTRCVRVRYRRMSRLWGRMYQCSSDIHHVSKLTDLTRRTQLCASSDLQQVVTESHKSPSIINKLVTIHFQEKQEVYYFITLFLGVKGGILLRLVLDTRQVAQIN